MSSEFPSREVTAANERPVQHGEHSTQRNLIGLTAASFAQVVIQFLIQVVLAFQFGAKAEADALAAALVIPTMLASIISGSLSYCLVPDLVACFSSVEKQRDGARIAGWFGLVSIGIALGASLLVWALAGEIVHWLYGSLNATQQSATSDLLRTLSWQILMSTVISWSLAVHHSRRSFIVPALGGVWGTLATLLMAMALGKHGIQWIAQAINVGSLLSAIIHVVPIRNVVGFGPVPLPQMTRLLWAMLPLIAGSLYLRIEPLVDRSLASRLQEGSLAHLNNAHRMVIALLSISTSGLSVIAFPQLAGRLASEGTDAFVQHFALAMRRLIMIVAPIAIGFGLYAVPVISDLLQRGRFDAHDSQAVGGLIVVFMGLFVGASWGELLARGFYTLGDTRTPTIVGAIAVTIGLLVKWFSLPYGGVWAIAGSGSLTVLISAVSMAVLLSQRTSAKLFSGCWRALAWSSAAALVACAFCYPPYTFSLGRTWVAAPVGALVYGLLIYPLAVEPDDKQAVKKQAGKETS